MQKGPVYCRWYYHGENGNGFYEKPSWEEDRERKYANEQRFPRFLLLFFPSDSILSSLTAKQLPRGVRNISFFLPKLPLAMVFNTAMENKLE